MTLEEVQSIVTIIAAFIIALSPIAYGIARAIVWLNDMQTKVALLRMDGDHNNEQFRKSLLSILERQTEHEEHTQAELSNLAEVVSRNNESYRELPNMIQANEK